MPIPPFIGNNIDANYDWNQDKLDLKLSLNVFDNKFDLFNVEVRDLSQNLMGKPLDTIVNSVEGFYNHVSPQVRERKNKIDELRQQAGNVRDFGGLSDLIRQAGENEIIMKGNEASYQIHMATANFLGNLNQQVNINTENIIRNAQKLDEHEDWLKRHDEQIHQHSLQIADHENRLNQHDKIISAHSKLLACHEKRLNQHEHTLNMHSKLLAVHEQRLNRHEAILNNHEKRLNQHESILNLHGSILRNHEDRLNQHAKAINDLYSIANEHNKILNLHGQKINELDERMFNAEKNILYFFDILNYC